MKKCLYKCKIILFFHFRVKKKISQAKVKMTSNFFNIIRISFLKAIEQNLQCFEGYKTNIHDYYSQARCCSLTSISEYV